MPWRPSEAGEVPTLGFYVIDWMIDNLAAPDKSDYEPFIPTMEQAQFLINFYAIDPWTGRRKIRRAVISRPKGWGKALALDTPVPTPTGWTTMGDLGVGDTVFDEKGQPCRVIGVSPTWDGTDCWRVTFSDGESVVASGDHLWTVEELTRSYSEVTVDTRTLAARQSTRSDGAANFRLPMPTPIACDEAALPIDPYTLGVWLGDGDSDGARITSTDDEIIDEIVVAGHRLLSRRGLRFSFADLRRPLRLSGLLNNKHVPRAYLRASEAQRLSLLQGLMDTDGSIDATGTCEFTTTTAALRDGVEELLASLGIKFSIYAGRAVLDGRDCGAKWRIKFTAYADVPVFRLRRKLERQREQGLNRRLCRTRRIVSVERVESVPTKCIEVSSNRSLFLVGRRMVQTHNSPFLAAIAAAEGLADVQFDGWDANGQPVGKPTMSIRTPWVQLLAVAEDQTRNAWAPLLEMLREGPACDNYPGLEPMETFVNLPFKGRIEFSTSAATSKEGQKPTFAVLDQTEEWKPSNGGRRLAETVRRNLGKVGGVSIESPNAYIPGDESVAEASHNFWKLILEGKTREEGLLYDHREWPPETDMTDRESMLTGLAYVYGESADVNGGWVDLDRLVAEIWDPSTEPQNARRYYGNAITHAIDSWISQPEWAACGNAAEVVSDGDVIVLGFDGSRHRTDAVTDATGLVGVRVHDGHMFTLGVWEQPDYIKDWWAPTLEIDLTVREAFKRFNVVGMYADPAADWRSFVANWERDFGADLKIKSTRDHPIEWWMGGQNLTKTVRATDQMYSAIVHKELSHDGSSALARHVLNARRRATRVGVQIAKDFPESPRKIDLAVAGILAWQARLDAVALGAVSATRTKSKRLRRF